MMAGDAERVAFESVRGYSDRRRTRSEWPWPARGDHGSDGYGSLELPLGC